MQKIGRQKVFYFACWILLLAGITGFFAVTTSNFKLLILTHVLMGIYISCANFYRFAATDNLDDKLKPHATSFVVLGGLLAAIVAPIISTTLQHSSYAEEFSLIYGVMSIFAIINFIVIYVWGRVTKFNIKNNNKSVSIPNTNKIKNYNSKFIFSAILTGSIGYLIMNVLMIQSSLAMNMEHSFSSSTLAIQIHVIAIFVPSFFTGKLIAHYGVWRVVNYSFILLTVSILWGIFFSEYYNIIIALLMLGVGWNLSYVAGSNLLEKYSPRHLKT